MVFLIVGFCVGFLILTITYMITKDLLRISKMPDPPTNPDPDDGKGKQIEEEEPPVNPDPS